MTEIYQRFLRATKKYKFITRAISFTGLVVGGSFFLKQFSTIRYEFRQGKTLSPEEAAEMGFKDIKAVQTEMLQEIQKEEADDWQNIRGPRPWEDSKIVQDLQRQHSTKES